MNLLTILCCAILVLSVLVGVYRGCIGSLISILFLVAVLILTLILTPFVSKVVAGSTYLRRSFTNLAEQFLSAYTTSSGNVDLSSLGGNGSLQASPFQAAAAVLSILLSAAGAPELTTEKLVGFMIGATATVITFVLVFLALTIVRIIIGKRVRESNLKTVDRILGFPIGLIKGLLIVWMILAVVDLLAFVPKLQPLAMQIPESPFLSWLNSHNLVRQGFIALISRMLG